MAYARAKRPARSFDRPLGVREHDGLTARERDRLAARLLPRPLLDEQELASFELRRSRAGRNVEARTREQDGYLEREGDLAVAVLVEIVNPPSE